MTCSTAQIGTANRLSHSQHEFRWQTPIYCRGSSQACRPMAAFPHLIRSRISCIVILCKLEKGFMLICQESLAQFCCHCKVEREVLQRRPCTMFRLGLVRTHYLQKQPSQQQPVPFTGLLLRSSPLLSQLSSLTRYPSSLVF